MDCSIVPLRHKGLFTVSTTDFFYPLIEDPFVLGKIACANVLSDQYAMGISECDNMLMLLASSVDMPETERRIVTRKMIEGFNEQAKEAGVVVTGGQTVQNPWPIIGGVAMSTVREEEMIRPENAQIGDLLVLTKPLGTQVAVNLHQWFLKKAHRLFNVAKEKISEEEMMKAYQKAILSMHRLNKTASILMHKYKAHAATDVTGFGIIGHANNLAKNQLKKGLKFLIHHLPVISQMDMIDQIEPGLFKLLRGFSSETSGGLLVCLPANEASSFIQELEKLDKQPAWIIGEVISSDSSENSAVLSDNIVVTSV